MDLTHPASLVSGLLVGVIGSAVFLYGKREQKPRCLFAGLALCVLPCIVGSVVLLWVVAGGCLGLLYATADA